MRVRHSTAALEAFLGPETFVVLETRAVRAVRAALRRSVMAPIDFDEALRAMISAVAPMSAESVVLAEALGRVSAARVATNENAVPFPRSAMDGFAVRASDCATATPQHPIEFPIAGEVFAEKGETTLAAGTALAITTGAPLPTGADAVIPHEHTERRGNLLRVFAPMTAGDCVFPPGEDFQRGDELIAPSETLNAGKLALLAFAGETTVRVRRRPRVAIVCTGNELVDIATVPARGQVRNSNAVALHALVLAAGGEPRYEGVARDDRAALAAMLEKARSGADVLITTGGASVGDRDFVKSVLGDLGARFRFTEVAMRPGRPMGFAEWDEVPVCVLPGNPVAVFVCFQKLVRPALARMLGQREIEFPSVTARLDGEIHARPGRHYFVLAVLRREEDGFVVSPLRNQCSALVRTTADANAIITVHGSASESPAGLFRGDFVEAEIFDWRGVFESSRTLLLERAALRNGETS